MNANLILFTEQRLSAGVIPFSQAAAYVNRYHRHNKAPIGHIYSIGCYYYGQLVGVAMCGRPVGRKLDDGKTIEVYRVCTQGHKNACSKLYSYCIRYARKKGFVKVITYTLLSETAASVKASNFKLDAQNVGGKQWNGRTEFKGVAELKNRWVYQLKSA